MTTYRYLIIGGGMSASAAIEGIRDRDKEGTIGLITAESDKPYDRPPLSKGLWKEDIGLDAIIHTLPNGVDVVTDRRVESLHIAQQEVTDDHGQSYHYEKLLLATGSTPKRLPFAPDDQIIYYRTLQDYRHLRKLTEQHDSFAVIGGSFIGSEIAAALRLNGKEVTLIFPEEAICARLFPADVSGYLNRYYESKGVSVSPNTKIEAIQGALGDYQLHTAGGTKIAAEVIVAGIGVEPNTGLATVAGLQVDDGILVNDCLQTSAPNIYAAGDVARFEDKVMHQWRRVEHEDNALTMGKAAGRAMAGITDPYTHSPMFYSDLFDLGYEAVGELSATLETYADWQEKYEKGVIYYLEEERVKGILLWNVWDQVESATQLIAENRKIKEPQDLQGRIR